MPDIYESISRSIDAINDIVLDKLGDAEAREAMKREVEILKAISQPWGDA